MWKNSRFIGFVLVFGMIFIIAANRGSAAGSTASAAPDINQPDVPIQQMVDSNRRAVNALPIIERLYSGQNQEVTPTATLDPAAFDMNNVVNYTSPDGVLSLNVPKPWASQPTYALGSYTLRYNTGLNALDFSVYIGTPNSLYPSILGLIYKAKEPDDPRTALEKYVQNSASRSGVKFGEIHPIVISKLDGYGVDVDIMENSADGVPAISAELWIATAAPDKVLIVLMRGRADQWQMAQQTMHQIAESAVINMQQYPTFIPSRTPHPLMESQIAVQKLILSWTPLPTETPVQRAH
jgi:hypothetical protein